MFNKLLVKVLLRENSRLRRECARKEKQLAECIDRLVHNKVPERFTSERSPLSLPQVSAYPSDSYSQAIEDAERMADGYSPPVEVEDEEDQ